MERDTALFLLSISLSFSPMVETCLLYSIEVFPSPILEKSFLFFFSPVFFFFFPVHFFVPYLFLLFSSMLSFLLLCVLIFFPYVYVCVCSLALFVCSNAREEYFWVAVFFFLCSRTRFVSSGFAVFVALLSHPAFSGMCI